MRISGLKVVPAPCQRYICLSCRLQGVGLLSGRRFQHAAPSPHSQADVKLTNIKDGVGTDKSEVSGGASEISEVVRGIVPDDGAGEANANHDVPCLNGISEQTKRSQKPEHSRDDVEAKQKVLQQKFAAQRRRQLSKFHADGVTKVPEDYEALLELTQGPSEPTKQLNHSTGSRKSGEQKLTKRQARRAQKRALKQGSTKLKRNGQDLSSRPDQETSNDSSNPADRPKKLVESAQRVAEKGAVSTAHSKEEASTSKPAAAEHEAKTSEGTTVKQKRHREQQPKKLKQKGTSSGKGRKAQAAKEGADAKSAPSEKERKAELAQKLSFRKTHSAFLTKNESTSEKDLDRKGPNNTGEGSSDFAGVAGWQSLAGALGAGLSKKQATIERADATKLQIQPIKVDQPPVPSLAYGLERVLFNPGVYQLQDPRSRVYNFDPYLQKIMPVADFDFSALREYITSSKDESLNAIARKYHKRYMGSTSSMTGMLAHFHFLLSQWRPIDTSMLSKKFPANLSSFSELQRTPSAIFLRWKNDGSYAIDADKEFDSANILSMLGKSMEKLLTLKSDDYEKYRKSSPDEVSEEEQSSPESYHYSTMGDFLMRSQLDAHDPRLPGTGMFDLKTRAVVSIRMDVTNYELGLGYQIKSRQGEWESFEREYYDMIRAAFLKYSMQVRMGRMDGIFVAFHNIERIFGFQYISLSEMDSTIHGQWDTSLGDQEFKLGLDLLNKILDKATKRFPKTSVRIHFETRDAATPFMYIFAEPVSEEQVAAIQSQNSAKIQEFERNILGLKRGVESEAQAAQADQEDDGKWDNIQASVQEAMDEDELSINGPKENQESNTEDMRDDPLYAGEIPVGTDEGLEVATVGDCVDEAEDCDVAENRQSLDAITKHESNGVDEGENAEDAPESDEEGEYEKGSQVDEDNANKTNESVALGEAVEDENAVINDVADQELESPESAPENNDPNKVLEPEVSNSSERIENPTEGEVTQEIRPSPGESTKDAEKAAYQPPVPGEEILKYQTRADQPFLDTIDEETNQADSSASASSDILAMTLTLRNKVNNQYVHRPTNLTDKDVWSIEYNLLEVPTQEKAKALYRACQARRKKKLDDRGVPEDADTITAYLANLRRLSKSGRQWRKEMDEEESKTPVQVLGKDLSSLKGGDSLLDQ